MAIFESCNGCPDRKIVDGVRCHSWCEKYAKEAEVNQKRLKTEHQESLEAAYVIDTIRKRNRRLNRRKRKESSS